MNIKQASFTSICFWFTVYRLARVFGLHIPRVAQQTWKRLDTSHTMLVMRLAAWHVDFYGSDK